MIGLQEKFQKLMIGNDFWKIREKFKKLFEKIFLYFRLFLCLFFFFNHFLPFSLFFIFPTSPRIQVSSLTIWFIQSQNFSTIEKIKKDILHTWLVTFIEPRRMVPFLKFWQQFESRAFSFRIVQKNKILYIFRNF